MLGIINIMIKSITVEKIKCLSIPMKCCLALSDCRERGAFALQTPQLAHCSLSVAAV